MPDETAGMMGGSPAAPAGAPPGAAPSGQATGPTPATSPVANQGAVAVANAALAVIAQRLQQLLVVLPVGSDVARDVREAVNKIAKHVPPGAVSQGQMMTEAQKNLMTQREMGPQIAAMRSAQPPGAPPTPAAPQPMAA